MTQPESRLSAKIQKAWAEKGVWAFKVHGSEFQPSGIPDIVGVYQGLFIACETKMPGNSLSEIQKFRIRRIRTAGGLVVVAYSVADAMQMLFHIDREHLDPVYAADHAMVRKPCPYRVAGAHE